jgi:hypothetical protein
MEAAADGSSGDGVFAAAINTNHRMVAAASPVEAIASKYKVDWIQIDIGIWDTIIFMSQISLLCCCLDFERIQARRMEGWWGMTWK